MTCDSSEYLILILYDVVPVQEVGRGEDLHATVPQDGLQAQLVAFPQQCQRFLRAPRRVECPFGRSGCRRPLERDATVSVSLFLYYFSYVCGWLSVKIPILILTEALYTCVRGWLSVNFWKEDNLPINYTICIMFPPMLHSYNVIGVDDNRSLTHTLS